MRGLAGARSKALRILMVVALLPAFVNTASVSGGGVSAPLTPFNIDVLGHSGGIIGSVEATGTQVLAAQGNALVSYDVSTGDAVAGGSTMLADIGGPTAIDGDRYYSAGEYRISIVDVADPGAPVFLGSASMPSESYSIVGMFAAGDYLYMGYEKYGDFAMKVIDVSDPVNPVVTAYVDCPIIGTGEVFGDAAYALNPDGGVSVIDISTPGQPVLVTAIPYGETADSLAVSGGYLYVSTYDWDTGAGDLYPYDLTDPLDPSVSSAVPGPVLSIDAAGDRLWGMDDAGNFQAWDIGSDPSLPSFRQEAAVTGFDIAAIGPASAVLLNADETGSTATLITDNIGGLTTTGTIMSEAGDAAVALREGVAFVLSPSGLRSIDTSAADFPVLGFQGILDTSDIVLSPDGTAAFVAGAAGLNTYDVEDPSIIMAAGDLTLIGGLERLALSDDGTVLFGVSGETLVAIDVTDVWNPVVLDTVVLTDPITDVDAADSRVWITLDQGDGSGTLQEYDFSVSAELGLLGEHGLPGDIPCITVEGDYAYVGLSSLEWGGSGTKVFDVSEPGALSYLYYASLGRMVATDVWAADGQLTSVGDGGLLLTGVYEPTMPYPLGYAGIPGARIARLGDFIATTHQDGGTTFAACAPVSFRSFGGSRYDTAIAMSQTFDSSEYVVLATGRSYPDALAGVPLAYALNAPILLTEASYIPANVVTEIERLGATKAIVLGGTAALSDAVVTQLRGMGFATEDIERIYGATRYETAKEIALRLELIKGEGAIDKVFVATGTNFPDALAVAGVAARSGCPILLVKPNDPNVATLAAINDLGATDSVIVGGTMVVSPQVAATLPSPERLSGTTRFDTAVVIANWAMADPTAAFSASKLFVVTGLNFPDALSSGVVAAANSAPTLLMSESQPGATLAFVREHGSEIDSVSIVGGTAAVSSAMEHWIATYASR